MLVNLPFQPEINKFFYQFWVWLLKLFSDKPVLQQSMAFILRTFDRKFIRIDKAINRLFHAPYMIGMATLRNNWSLLFSDCFETNIAGWALFRLTFFLFFLFHHSCLISLLLKLLTCWLRSWLVLYDFQPWEIYLLHIEIGWLILYSNSLPSIHNLGTIKSGLIHFIWSSNLFGLIVLVFIHLKVLIINNW